jgi:hypothetical protein
LYRQWQISVKVDSVVNAVKFPKTIRIVKGDKTYQACVLLGMESSTTNETTSRVLPMAFAEPRIPPVRHVCLQDQIDFNILYVYTFQIEHIF